MKLQGKQIQEDMEAASTYDINKEIKRGFILVVIVLIIAIVGLIFLSRSDETQLNAAPVATIVGYPSPANGSCELRYIYGPGPGNPNMLYGVDLWCYQNGWYFAGRVK